MRGVPVGVCKLPRQLYIPFQGGGAFSRLQFRLQRTRYTETLQFDTQNFATIMAMILGMLEIRGFCSNAARLVVPAARTAARTTASRFHAPNPGCWFVHVGGVS